MLRHIATTNNTGSEKSLSSFSPIQKTPYNTMGLTELEKLCKREIENYYNGEASDAQYGLELFHRATTVHDSLAWEALQRCFSGIVRSWLHRHPQWEVAYAIDSEENYIAQAFTRFWYASIKNPALQFKTLAAALEYLRASLNGAVMDTLRVYSRPREVALPATGSARQPAVEEWEDRSELWEIIRGMLANEREMRVAYLHFLCGLKAREIIQFCPREFKDAREIYGIRRNLFKRLVRNADQIRRRLGQDEF